MYPRYQHSFLPGTLFVPDGLLWVVVRSSHRNTQFQWWRNLFRCRIDLLNFSMGFNIIAPYMEFLHLNWYIAEWFWKCPWPMHRAKARCKVCISMYITYISVSKSTPLAVTGPHGQLASNILLDFVLTSRIRSSLSHDLMHVCFSFKVRLLVRDFLDHLIFIN